MIYLQSYKNASLLDNITHNLTQIQTISAYTNGCTFVFISYFFTKTLLFRNTKEPKRKKKEVKTENRKYIT